MTDAKPREFWIEKVELEDDIQFITWSFNPPFDGDEALNPDDFIHVIEKSAYDKLQAELEAAKNDLEIAYAGERDLKRAAQDKIKALERELKAESTLRTLDINLCNRFEQENTRLRELVRELRDVCNGVFAPDKARQILNKADNILKSEGRDD